MYKLKNALIALIGLISLMTIATVVLPRAGTAAPAPSTQNVKVVNGVSEPVPIQGNATVNGTVQAAQSGSWNVGINGTPVVGLDAGNNTVKFDAVNNTVKIDAATPVVVRDADNPARQPFQAATDLVLPFGQTQAFRNFITVPIGKVLVIENVSAEGRLFGNDKLVVLAITVDGTSLFLHPNDEGTDDQGRGIFIASQQVRLYVKEGLQVGCFAERNPATSQPDVTFSVFGYFVDQQ